MTASQEPPLTRREVRERERLREEQAAAAAAAPTNPPAPSFPIQPPPQPYQTAGQPNGVPASPYSAPSAPPSQSSVPGAPPSAPARPSAPERTLTRRELRAMLDSHSGDGLEDFDDDALGLPAASTPPQRAPAATSPWPPAQAAPQVPTAAPTGDHRPTAPTWRPQAQPTVVPTPAPTPTPPPQQQPQPQPTAPRVQPPQPQPQPEPQPQSRQPSPPSSGPESAPARPVETSALHDQVPTRPAAPNPFAELAQEEPLAAQKPVGHWTSQLDMPEERAEPYDQLLSRGGVTRGVPTTTNALILPTLPDQVPMAASMQGSEIIVTGSIDLPRSFGASGVHPSRVDSSDIDRLFDQVEDAATGAAPVAATRAISTQGASRTMMTPPRKEGVNLPLVLAITAGVLALGVVATLVIGAVVGLF